MSESTLDDISYPVRSRLFLLEFLAEEYGYVNRSALIKYFGISTPQASSDIKLYLKHRPNNLTYDKSKKAYLKTNDFIKLF